MSAVVRTDVKTKITGGFTSNRSTVSVSSQGGGAAAIPALEEAASTAPSGISLGSTTTLFDLCGTSYVNRNAGRRKRVASGNKTKENVSDLGRNTLEPRGSNTAPDHHLAPNKDTETSKPLAGPQVEIINGKIVIRESSLVVNNDAAGDEEYEEVTEGIHATATYSSFLKRRKSVAWGFEETRIFYNCLRQCGTDFSMMQAFFPGRTRKQLKKKFYREEKEHPELIKRALYTSLPLEMSPFESQLGLPSSQSQSNVTAVDGDSDDDENPHASKGASTMGDSHSLAENGGTRVMGKVSNKRKINENVVTTEEGLHKSSNQSIDANATKISRNEEESDLIDV